MRYVERKFEWFEWNFIWVTIREEWKGNDRRKKKSAKNVWDIQVIVFDVKLNLVNLLKYDSTGEKGKLWQNIHGAKVNSSVLKDNTQVKSEDNRMSNLLRTMDMMITGVKFQENWLLIIDHSTKLGHAWLSNHQILDNQFFRVINKRTLIATLSQSFVTLLLFRPKSFHIITEQIGYG